jgi:hypothetical protein
VSHLKIRTASRVLPRRYPAKYQIAATIPTSTTTIPVIFMVLSNIVFDFGDVAITVHCHRNLRLPQEKAPSGIH